MSLYNDIVVVKLYDAMPVVSPVAGPIFTSRPYLSEDLLDSTVKILWSRLSLPVICFHFSCHEFVGSVVSNSA
jgi:hypothetical protein